MKIVSDEEFKMLPPGTIWAIATDYNNGEGHPYLDGAYYFKISLPDITEDVVVWSDITEDVVVWEKADIQALIDVLQEALKVAK